jgi:hypothetical protein
MKISLLKGQGVDMGFTAQTFKDFCDRRENDNPLKLCSCGGTGMPRLKTQSPEGYRVVAGVSLYFEKHQFTQICCDSCGFETYAEHSHAEQSWSDWNKHFGRGD